MDITRFSYFPWDHTLTWYASALGVDFCYYLMHTACHGSNKYCLDVNYGGVLIIWDRIFGTFRPETDKIEIVYGLIYNQPSFNPLYLQGMTPISIFVLYIIGSLTVIGMLFDDSKNAALLEVIRCSALTFFTRSVAVTSPGLATGLQMFYVASAMFWCLNILKFLKMKKTSKMDYEDNQTNQQIRLII